MTKYVVADYWEHADLRLFGLRATDLTTALALVEQRQLRWAGADNAPSHVQIFELKASYPQNLPPPEADPPSKTGNVKSFPNL